MYVLAIDPGAKGGFVVVDSKRKVHVTCGFTNKTPKEIASNLMLALGRYSPEVVMEKVGPMPMQPAASTFTFGKHVGLLEGVLIALGWGFRLVTPQKWQALVLEGERFESKQERKNALKEEAQLLFPTTKVTLAITDALLIAHWFFKKSPQ